MINIALLAVLILIIVIVTLAYHLAGGGESCGHTALAIDTCQGSVRQQLNDPDSARFGDDWTAAVWPISVHDIYATPLRRIPRPEAGCRELARTMTGG